MSSTKSVVKPQNGEGESGTLLLSFNLGSESDREAYKFTQELAQRGHGVRKSIFISLILALKEYEGITQREFSPNEAMALFMSSGRLPNNEYAPPARQARIETVSMDSQVKAADFDMEGF